MRYPCRPIACRIRKRLLTLLLGVGLATPSLTSLANTHDSIRVLGVDYLGDLPTLIAVEQGMFRRHGLGIEFTHSPSGKQNLQALRSGEADIALMSTTPLVLDLLETPPTGEANDPLIVASLVYSSRLNHVVALGTSDIRDPSDLAGRRIGLMAGTNAEFELTPNSWTVHSAGAQGLSPVLYGAQAF